MITTLHPYTEDPGGLTEKATQPNDTLEAPVDAEEAPDGAGGARL